MSKFLFVTGTDTGVGKTFVTSCLIRGLNIQRVDYRICKPIESGIDEGAISDGEIYARLSGRPLSEVGPIRLRVPAAPTVAAAVEGRTITWSEVVTHLELLAEASPLVVVEGVGGPLVPLTENKTFADLALQLDAAVLVVVGSKLGAINHSSLTFECLFRRGLPTLGYVFNEPFPDDAAKYPDAQETNRQQILAAAKCYNLPELGYFPFVEDDALVVESSSALATAVTRGLSS